MKLDTKAVRHLMVERGIASQSELGRRIGMSRNSVTDLLRGHNQPSMDTLGALCRVLKCEPNDILARDNPDIERVAPAVSKPLYA